MNRHLSVVAVLVLWTPLFLFGYTGLGGGRGLLHVQDALTEETGVDIDIHGVGRHPYFSEPSTKKGYVVDIVGPGLTITPFVSKFFATELYASFGGVAQYPETAEGKKWPWGFDHVKPGLKLVVPYLPVFKLGAAADYTFKFHDVAIPDRLDPQALPIDTAAPLNWTVLPAFHFQDLTPAAPNLLLNWGRYAGQRRYGAGLEFAAEGMSVFGEVRILQPDSLAPMDLFNTDKGCDIRITAPAVSWRLSRMFAIQGGYTFSFGSASANEVVLGIDVFTPFLRKPPVQFGDLSGKVINRTTREPLAAKIEFPDNPKLAPAQSDASGLFTVKHLVAAQYRIRITADGFRPYDNFVNVQAKPVEPYLFELDPLVVYGTVAGLVTDALTGRPLAATIEFPDTNIPAVKSDATTGAYRVDNVPVGPYTITATADGYFKLPATIQVTATPVATQNFALQPLTVKTVVTGTVTDRGTNAPIAAQVSFKDVTTQTVIAEVANDPSTGVYAAEVPVGTYAVTAKSEGYIDQSTALVVEKDKPAKQDFALVKPGTTITLRNIYFDFDKATIKIPQSQEALDGAAKILKDNPTIKVEIQGHTDNIGSDEYNQRLSEKRAWAVVNYLVQNYGIDPTRLTAKGYGETMPKTTNDTPEGRAINRRVEFVVLGEVPQR